VSRPHPSGPLEKPPDELGELDTDLQERLRAVGTGPAPTLPLASRGRRDGGIAVGLERLRRALIEVRLPPEDVADHVLRPMDRVGGGEDDVDLLVFPTSSRPATRVAGVTAQVWLQGGGEFSRGCEPMDAELVRRIDGPVVVSALAGTVGRDYRTATENGVRHFLAVGATEVIAAPDAREDRAAAIQVLSSARLIVLPGGSPSRLLDALRATGADEVLAALLADGGAVMGSSAGAMVLGSWTVLPDRRDADGGMQVVPGLGLAPGLLVVPHWSGAASRGDWLRTIDTHVPDDTTLLGVAEESGVRFEGSTLTAVGKRSAALVRQDLELLPDESWRRPGDPP